MSCEGLNLVREFIIITVIIDQFCLAWLGKADAEGTGSRPGLIW